MKKNYDYIFTKLRNSAFMDLIGASLEEIDQGYARVFLPLNKNILNSHQFIHGGVLVTISDIAGAAACMTMLPPEKKIVTVEIKTNFLQPVKEDVWAEGKVMHIGSLICVSNIVVFNKNKNNMCIAIGTFSHRQGKKTP